MFLALNPYTWAYVSSSLKKATRMARYALEKSFTASASDGSMYRTGIPSFRAASFKSSANFLPFSIWTGFFPSTPTTMRDGYRLSFNVFPSRRNSGENKIFSVRYIPHSFLVNPGGTVDLMTMHASGFTFRICPATASTEVVSNRFLSGS